jgi:hypothetical protein
MVFARSVLQRARSSSSSRDGPLAPARSPQQQQQQQQPQPQPRGGSRGSDDRSATAGTTQLDRWLADANLQSQAALLRSAGIADVQDIVAGGVPVECLREMPAGVADRLQRKVRQQQAKQQQPQKPPPQPQPAQWSRSGQLSPSLSPPLSFSNWDEPESVAEMVVNPLGPDGGAAQQHEAAAAAAADEPTEHGQDLKHQQQLEELRQLAA